MVRDLYDGPPAYLHVACAHQKDNLTARRQSRADLNVATFHADIAQACENRRSAFVATKFHSTVATVAGGLSSGGGNVGHRSPYGMSQAQGLKVRGRRGERMCRKRAGKLSLFGAEKTLPRFETVDPDLPCLRRGGTTDPDHFQTRFLIAVLDANDLSHTDTRHAGQPRA